MQYQKAFPVNPAVSNVGSPISNTPIPTPSTGFPIPVVSVDIKKIDWPAEVLNSTLYFVHGNYLYKSSPINSLSKILSNVDSYAISPDRKKIAYLELENNAGSGMDNSQIKIFSLADGKVTTVLEKAASSARRLDWSPDGNYLLVDFGTGPEGSLTAYDLTTDQKLVSFSDGNFIWLDNKTIFLTQRSTIELARPWGAGEGFRLAKVNITTGTSEILLEADANNDYSVLKLKGNCLYYQQSQVISQSDWGVVGKPTVSYHCFDINNKSIVDATENEAVPTFNLLKIQLQKIFPKYNSIGKNEILSVEKIKESSNWVIMTLYHGGSIYDCDILILNLDNPRSTLIKIATGEDLTWF